MSDLEAMKKRRDKLSARIQQAEAKKLAANRKEETRIKILVGAAILTAIKNEVPITIDKPHQLLTLMNNFLERETDKKAIFGDNGKASEALVRLAAPVPKPETETENPNKKRLKRKSENLHGKAIQKSAAEAGRREKAIGTGNTCVRVAGRWGRCRDAPRGLQGHAQISIRVG